MPSFSSITSKSFLAETERQVQEHLKQHISIFPKKEEKAIRILKKMYQDEGEHADWAEKNFVDNKSKLSKFEKKTMRLMAKLMIVLSRRV